MASSSLLQHQAGPDKGRLLSLVGGGVALGWGLQRRNLPGLLAGAAGGMLLYYSINGGGKNAAGEGVNITTSTCINRSPEELYNFWHGFVRLPEFMRYLKEVSPRGPNRTHWVARSPIGVAVEWDSEVTVDKPSERIGWRSIKGSELMNEGEVRFIPPASSREQGTMVELAMRFQPPAGRAIGQLLSGLTEKQIDADLHRFKRLMESGGAAPEGAKAQ